MSKCSITQEQGGLLVRTPYDPGFVAAIKNLPASARKFDPTTKGWLVDPQYGGQVTTWIEAFWGEKLAPLVVQAPPATELRAIDLRYLGACKDRGSEHSAFGLSDGDWKIVMPEQVLRQWFDGIQTTEQAGPQTMYSVLGVQQNAQAEEIKRAFRRMSLQWHPDHCREPDAHDRFIRIKQAYDVLSQPGKRARYDAGLALEMSLSNHQQPRSLPGQGYRAPLRCGYVLAEGRPQVGRFRVEKILAWDDITNASGQTLVTSWPMGSTKPVEQWV